MDDGTTERTPGAKLLFAGLIALALTVPLMMVYALVGDRQSQSATARAAIVQGWGTEQVVAGPVLVIPWRDVQTEGSGSGARRVETERELFVSPTVNDFQTRLAPQQRRKSIYSTILYDAAIAGKATFALPADLATLGVPRDALLLDRAEIRFGVADARGLRPGSKLAAGGAALQPQPGKGLAATAGQGFFAPVKWSGEGELAVRYSYDLRGSGQIAVVPRGGRTRWEVRSPWPHPSFGGSFLPDRSRHGEAGFEAVYSIDNLALGEPQASRADIGRAASAPGGPEEARTGNRARAVVVGLVEPVDLYSQVDRAVKYGFLFIGFTFLVFLMFDIVGKARVAAAEYLLTGAALVLFFVLLLAFAEVIGFAAAYAVASAAIVVLLTAYSAAVLGSWARARFVGGLLAVLYAVLFILLDLEAWSLLIGSLLMFAALAGVMYATRRIDWGRVGPI